MITTKLTWIMGLSFITDNLYLHVKYFITEQSSITGRLLEIAIKIYYLSEIHQILHQETD